MFVQHFYYSICLTPGCTFPFLCAKLDYMYYCRLKIIYKSGGWPVMKEKILSGERETLFLPLYSKAKISRTNGIFTDKTAEKIVSSLEYDFSKNKMSKFVDIYMALRASIIDDYCNTFLKNNPGAVVLHLGCGLDSRINRITENYKMWYDLDFPEVTALRKKFYQENNTYKMIPSSVTDLEWLNYIRTDNSPVLIIAEGLTMYLNDSDIKNLFLAFRNKFTLAYFIFDAYSVTSVKLSKYKNPVNKMGAVISWGLDDPGETEKYSPDILHLETIYFTGSKKIEKLGKFDRFMFRFLYSNKFMKNLYRIYIFKIEKINTDMR